MQFCWSKILIKFTSPGRRVYEKTFFNPLMRASFPKVMYSTNCLFNAIQSLPPSIRIPINKKNIKFIL